MDNKLYLKKGLEKIAVAATTEQIDLMIKFMEMVLESNKKFNLTAIKDEKQFIEKHLIDSASIIPILNKIKFKSILDIGAGAGFPGMIIGIFFPKYFLTLLDSTAKKVKFMKNAAEQLGLTNILTLSIRAEELLEMPEYKKSYDIVTARAVASLNILSELALPLCKVGGKFLAMKACDAQEELNNARNAISVLGGEHLETKDLKLPYSGAKRKIIIIQKIKKTPNTFPRKYSIIKKQPL